MIHARTQSFGNQWREKMRELKPMRGWKHSPELPERNSVWASEEKSPRSTALNVQRCTSCQWGRQPGLINDEMQPWAQVMGSVCRWKNTKAAGRMNLFTSRREENGRLCVNVGWTLRALMSITNSTAHPHILLDYSLNSFLSSLLSPIPLSPSHFTSWHLPILHSYLDSTLHFPSLSPLFLPRPHYLFLLFSHTSQPPPFFAVSQYSMATASCCCTDLSSFYVTALFPSLPFGHVVSCLQPLQSAIDNGRPLLIKLLCLHSLLLLYDREMKCQQRVGQLFSRRCLFFRHFN